MGALHHDGAHGRVAVWLHGIQRVTRRLPIQAHLAKVWAQLLWRVVLLLLLGVKYRH